METHPAQGPQRGAGGFLNFLRGMETGTEPRIARFVPRFLNFLRGMETEFEMSGKVVGRCFLNFLRGMETRISSPRSTTGARTS